MADNARGIHVSPGIYSKETDMTYAVKSLGITTLGVVGETLKGPAFQPMLVENWREYQSLFGGTSPEKFKGSQYPKYELPYIAKSYLQESNQLQVCRVLGLSGYNAGPAWVIRAAVSGVGVEGTKYVPIAVLRSRGHYEQYHKFSPSVGSCDCPQETYDTLFYSVGEWAETSVQCNEPKVYNLNALKLEPYMALDSQGNECDGWQLGSTATGFGVSALNYGQFKICGVQGPQNKESWTDDFTKDTVGYFEYPVSLNPGSKDYILKVLGTTPSDGDAPIYVESLYDVMLQQLIETNKVSEIDKTLEKYQVYHTSDYCGLEPVFGIVSKQEESLLRKNIGQRYLADKVAKINHVHCHPYDWETNKPLTIKKYNELKGKVTLNTTDYINGVTDENALVMDDMKVGGIYTVVQYTDSTGKRHYYYRYYVNVPDVTSADFSVMAMISASDYLTQAYEYKIPSDEGGPTPHSTPSRFASIVLNKTDERYYRLSIDKSDVAPVTCDMNNYRDAYRFASTPWIVSNIKGDATKIELNKLFRFHTISDGKTANNEIKISIMNVRPDDGVFDVAVRAINDTDESPVFLERFTKCSLVPSTSNYIAYKIGSYDGTYESKSKFITVEINDDSSAIRNSVPAGFLGYPLSDFSGLEVSSATDAHEEMVNPLIAYNIYYNQDIKNRKQYFGLSPLTGVDIDMFTYKGSVAYGDEPSYLSQGFHLDSRLNTSAYEEGQAPKVTVDGVSGYKFDAVSSNNRTQILDETPVIGTEAEMIGSIYEYVDLRKFTVYFYGGFDGWDEYRNYRSNTDDFKLSKYRGAYNEANGVGLSFNLIKDSDSLNLNQQGITSDWYAYLSGIRQFANPEYVDINVFATPGIDIVNNKTLVDEVIEMIEEERADSVYVATMPDKPFGSSDYVEDMYTPDDVVYELEDTEIDSNYTTTYYPWVKYEDVDNHQFIYLPATKDVVRNMALTDNTSYSWFAPAGLYRGDVDCVRAHYVTKLSDEDVLYEGRINPIKTFASDGVKVWGQKNLQKRDSQLNRIAVRRLLLRMRKLISIACIGLIFEPNDGTTKNSFLSTVTPIMDNIKSNRGISDYRIEIDNSVESRDRRELPVKIYFKPYDALEYIDLNFILTPEGVSFDNI